MNQQELKSYTAQQLEQFVDVKDGIQMALNQTQTVHVGIYPGGRTYDEHFNYKKWSSYKSAVGFIHETGAVRSPFVRNRFCYTWYSPSLLQNRSYCNEPHLHRHR